MKSDEISLFNNPRSKLTYFYTPFVYIKHGGPFCKFLGPSVLASIFLKKQTLEATIGRNLFHSRVEFKKSKSATQTCPIEPVGVP